jgi:IclR family pca regulon transcriptional regulator
VLLAAETRTAFGAWMKGRALQRLTMHTVTEAKRFRELIAEVRRFDHCVAIEEHELGVHALAVPLRNMQGRTVAALNVVASPARTGREAMERELLPPMLDAARELRGLL